MGPAPAHVARSRQLQRLFRPLILGSDELTPHKSTCRSLSPTPPSVQLLHQLQAFGTITRRRDGTKGSLVEEKVPEPAKEKVPDDEAAEEMAPVGRHRSRLPAP